MGMIGHYEIRELLGEGGIGQVHVGFDTVLEREVAIKSLRPELLNDKNFVDRFRAEATSLARLNHPNVTTVYSLLPEGTLVLGMSERSMPPICFEQRTRHYAFSVSATYRLRNLVRPYFQLPACRQDERPRGR